MKKNFWTILFLAVILPLFALADGYSLKVDDVTYVYGTTGEATATFSLFLSNEDYLKVFFVQVVMPEELDGVLAAKSQSLAPAVQSIVDSYGSNTARITYNSMERTATFRFSGTTNGATFPASSEYVKLAELVFTIDNAAADALETGKLFAVNVIPYQQGSNGWYHESASNTPPVSEVATDAGSFSVVKLFNAAAVEQEAGDDDSPVTIGFDGAFTDDTGAEVAATVTAVTATTDAAYGAFTLSAGAVTWTAPAVPPTPHVAYDATATYTAEDADGNQDSNTITLTVTPKDTPPVVTFTECTATEGEALVVKFTATDVDGDTIVPPTTVTLGGVAYAGECAADGDSYTFTSADALSYDTVAHPSETASLALTFTVGTSYVVDETEEEGESADVSVNVTANDTDRSPSGVTASIDLDSPKTGDDVTASGSVTTADPDGDEVTFTYSWSNGAATVTNATLASTNTKKGEEWTVTVGFTTSPYGTAKAGEETNTASVTIANTAPVAAEAFQKFIQKTGSDITGTITITAADDPDVDDDVDTLTYAITSKPDGLTISGIEGNVVSFSIASTVEEFEGEVAYTVSDGDATVDGTFTVKYAENPAPVITLGETDIEDGGSYPEVDDAGEATVLVVNVTAQDQTEEGAPAASGVTSITWTLTDPIRRCGGRHRLHHPHPGLRRPGRR